MGGGVSLYHIKMGDLKPSTLQLPASLYATCKPVCHTELAYQTYYYKYANQHKFMAQNLRYEEWLSTRLYNPTMQKAAIFIITTIRTSYPTWLWFAFYETVWYVHCD